MRYVAVKSEFGKCVYRGGLILGVICDRQA